MIMWRLYYADRTTFSSSDGPWLAAPAWRVMGLAYLDDVVGYYRNTNHFYIMPSWSEGQPYGADMWGLVDMLLDDGVMTPDQPMSSLPPQALIDAGVKFGRTLPDAEWQERLKWMASDPELPHKSARYAHERP